MTPKQVLSILSGRRQVALAVAATVIAVVAAVTWALPRQYTATASVILDVRSADQVVGGALSGLVEQAYRSTQIDMMMSERVARGALRSLELDRDPALRSLWLEAGEGRGDFEAWLAEGLVRKLTVQPSRGSNMIIVAYTADDGAVAANVANAFVKSFIDVSLEMKVEPVRQYGSFFDARARELRNALESAQAKLSSFEREHGLLAGDEKFDLANSQLVADMSSQLAAMRATNAELAQRERQARKQPGQLQEVLTDPLVSSLQSELAREETRARELASRVGESHPQWLEQSARIREVKSRLASATARAQGSVSLNSSVSQARVAEATAALNSQRERVMQVRGLREQATVLQREVDSAQRAYDAIQARVGQSNLEAQNTQSNVSILKQATVPMEPASPKVMRLLGAGFVAALVLGAGAAMLLELLDRRMRTQDDISELKQPMLISLPAADWRRAALKSGTVPMMKQRVLTGLPLPRPKS